MTIDQNCAAVRESVAQACARSGRDPRDVRIIAVSKTVGPDEVACAIAAGMHEFGENRSEQLQAKRSQFPDEAWHFIGNIQARKIKDIVGSAVLIHSVDREHLFARLDAQASSAGIVQDILLEVNVSGEESKSGFAPSALADALDEAMSCPGLRVCGLMTMAPAGDLEEARADFRGLRELRDRFAPRYGGNIGLRELSMGMTDDFEVAVEEGATMVRIGRKIFSQGMEAGLA